jgi:enterochelin esterase-like enzyme
MNSRLLLIPAALMILAVLPATVHAQPGGRPSYTSPEVHEDGRVTVRILAPRAEEVRVTGEILAGQPAPPMTRDSLGIWSVTLGPLQPDIYTYAFNVDGVSTPDPLNPYIKTVAGTGLATQVEVPGDGPQYYDARPVPHGMVSIVQYDSKTLGVPRTAWVYTPPGFMESQETYPVVYLLHGIGDTEIGWVLTGRANQIMDNLIADGAARPMIVVMPLGHIRQSIGIGAPATVSVQGEGLFQADLLARDLKEDLMPLVERTFRASSNPDDRAIMGLSMGGGQALSIGLHNLDTFHTVVGLSSALVGENPVQPFTDVLGNAAEVNQKLKLLYLTIGADDFLIEGNKAFDAALTNAGIEHTFKITEGAHWWRVWRRDLFEIAPLLFR